MALQTSDSTIKAISSSRKGPERRKFLLAERPTDEEIEAFILSERGRPLTLEEEKRFGRYLNPSRKFLP